jgi:uncharacterized cupredoxin-like copper-binding protein
MSYFTKFVAPSVTALAMTVAMAAPGWANTSVVRVSLWDKGAEAPMATDLGMGMKGNMAAATMGLKVSKTKVKAGKVTFEVTNTSKDSVHEMVVAAVKGSNAKLPYNASDSRVEENHIADLGEVSELQPGKSGSVTLDLKPGKYVLFCNVPGHYMDGMWKVITVD